MNSAVYLTVFWVTDLMYGDEDISPISSGEYDFLDIRKPPIEL